MHISLPKPSSGSSSHPLPITAASSLPLPLKYTSAATSRRLSFATSSVMATSTPPLVLTRARVGIGIAVSPSWRGTFGLGSSRPLLAQSRSSLRLVPLAADKISPIVCSLKNSYPSCDDDDSDDKFDLIVHKVLVHKVLKTAAEAIGTMTAFVVAGYTLFRHLKEFASQPTLSSLIDMFCGICEVGIAVRAAYLVYQNAKMRMDCNPKIVDDGHIDTLLLFILKKLLMFYSSSCLLKAGSPPYLVLVVIVLHLLLNQVSF